MNQGHVNPGEVVNLRTLTNEMPPESTFALVKTPDMEVIRMVLPGGKKVDEHSVKGEISVQCLEGKTLFTVEDKELELNEGDWLYLNRNQSHSLKALTDSVLLVTILFTDT
ncbi:MAG TPA: cupin domain-containing protein [Balneolaceae bacterium]